MSQFQKPKHGTPLSFIGFIARFSRPYHHHASHSSHVTSHRTPATNTHPHPSNHRPTTAAHPLSQRWSVVRQTILIAVSSLLSRTDYCAVLQRRSGLTMTMMMRCERRWIVAVRGNLVLLCRFCLRLRWQHSHLQAQPPHSSSYQHHFAAFRCQLRCASS